MAPDCLKMESLVFGAKLEKVETYIQLSQPCGILRTMLNRTWYQKLQESLKIFVGNEDNYYRTVSLFQWKKINFEIFWSKTTNLELRVKITSQFSLVSILGKDMCCRQTEFLHMTSLSCYEIKMSFSQHAESSLYSETENQLLYLAIDHVLNLKHLHLA